MAKKVNRKIILGSRSKARAKLLTQIGLSFSVTHSRVKESRRLTRGCKNLVISNALKKAKDVAKKYPKGIVIAADTVVLSGKKLIGKPKNIKDAFKTIKMLSKRSQWVYSGIAVIDIDEKKIYTASEKTKIYMHSMSDEQISNYFQKVSPLDKAGSFDIQGLGGMFIDRIEGCYFNVVGLPLAKLARILEEIGVKLF